MTIIAQPTWRQFPLRRIASAMLLASVAGPSYGGSDGAPPKAASPAAPAATQSAAAAAQPSPPAGAPAGRPTVTSNVPPDQAAAADWIEQAFAGSDMPESVRMLVAIARGSQMGPGEGWFGPSATRYDWNWLAGANGSPGATEIAQEQFRGPKEYFARLDRNQDGRIAPSDLDWSDRNPYVQHFNVVNRLLRRMNKKGDGRLTRDDFIAFFEQAADGRDYVTSADLAEVFLSGFGSNSSTSGGPPPEVLVRGLFRGEIGSLNSGPALNAAAPDFSLRTHDGQQTIRLGDLRGSKPVVLVFGNFTCGPFRSMYPLVDELCKRYRDRVNFLGVYVREAHPTDGWHMESDAAAGVELAQPKTYDERLSVAQQCQATLNYSMPLVVDEINDPVGNAYSGMPARLYVIDTEGKVAFKSGRGPFGFKPSELEHAIVMTLLDQTLESSPPVAAAK